MNSYTITHESHSSHKAWHSVLLYFFIIVIFWFGFELRKTYSRNNSTSIQVKIIDEDDKEQTSENINMDLVKRKKGNAKERIHVPKFMLDLFKENKYNGERNCSRPDIVRSVIPKQGGPSFIGPTLEDVIENHLLLFEIPVSNDDEELLEAELKILTLIQKEKSLRGVQRIITIIVYDESRSEFLHLGDHHLSHAENTWMSFNVTIPVKELLRSTTTNNKILKIIVSIRSMFSIGHLASADEFKLSLMPENNEDIEYEYPILLLSYKSRGDRKAYWKKQEQRGRQKRFKRDAEDYYEEDTNKLWETEQTGNAHVKKLRRLKNTCKKKPLFVNFAEIGYDSWILQPSGYQANQCVGKCFYPMADHLSPSKHAIIQSLVHNVASPKAARPCCTPVSLNSISLLYIDDKGILTYRFAYGDMVVDKCGCR